MPARVRRSPSCPSAGPAEAGDRSCARWSSGWPGRRSRSTARWSAPSAPGCASWSASPTPTPRPRRTAGRQGLAPAGLRRRATASMNRRRPTSARELLVVSQFTLYGDTRRGRRPSWVAAARPRRPSRCRARSSTRCATPGATVATGRFRADMQVELVNDGPVTLLLEVDAPAPLSRTASGARVAQAGVGIAWRRVGRPAAASAVEHPADRRRARGRGGGPGCRPSGRTRSRRCAAARRDRRSTACSLVAVRCWTSPSGDTKALNPVGATCTTQRPVSMARSRDEATCWVCTDVPV